MQSKIKLGGSFFVRCLDPVGREKWSDIADNLVVNVGLQHILDAVLTGATQVDPWYIGLTGSAPSPAAADTMASHAGWTEFTAYSGTLRLEYLETRSGQSASNAASKAVFVVNSAGQTIGGAFLVSVNSRGTTGGTLLCAAAFTGGNKSADADDTLEVTYTFGAADDGV